MPVDNRRLTYGEAAGRAGVPTYVIARAAAYGKLRTHEDEPGRHWVSPEDLNDWITDHLVPERQRAGTAHDLAPAVQAAFAENATAPVRHEGADPQVAGA